MNAVRGFALIPALFLIVVLASLAAVAVRVSASQSQTVIMGLQQARTLSAARAGLERGAWTALHGACGATTLNLTEQSLSGIQVVVSCSATSFAEGAGPALNSFALSSTATSGTYGKPDYVRRVLRATYTDAP